MTDSFSLDITAAVTQANSSYWARVFGELKLFI
jgi:hypothetical protein